MKLLFSRLGRAVCTALVALGCAAASHAAGAFDNPLSESAVQSTKNAVRSMIGHANALPAVPASASRGLPELALGTGGNVAGVLEYCVNSNVLNRVSVESVKATLLSHVGLSVGQDSDSAYREGLSGILTGVDGQSLDLRTAQPVLKEKACDYVLSSTKSLI
ncbi:uncharacterized protein DUF2501 [Comamonas sp. BIGb0124]|uniref:DUF2501 domain-containing protein n=1 Tax=Comamonas sp. BIGb0124 TaxID=2485130 RepID=UPI000F98D99C|nr:DUF2501 domain-containing protein [Comamonas sp. BIGb0124]ROR21022.1 uncharacterized protein DUF2501 [Comamonas sp. BIGb0124]